MWLAASSFAVPDGVLATLATAQLSGKPHQGVQSRNLASPPGIGECNSTAAIALRASLALNGLRQSERARYYGSALGRFTSPDPLLNSGRLENPQTWNRYTYGLNNPLGNTDPTGLYTCSGDKKQCSGVADALKAAKGALGNLKKGSAEYNALNSAINAGTAQEREIYVR